MEIYVQWLLAVLPVTLQKEIVLLAYVWLQWCCAGRLGPFVGAVLGRPGADNKGLPSARAVPRAKVLSSSLKLLSLNRYQYMHGSTNNTLFETQCLQLRS